MANGFQGPPAVDFYSMLSGLGDTIAKNREQSAIAGAFQPGADGKVDYHNALATVAQYNPALAVSMQNHLDAQAHQTIEDARNAKNDTFSHGMQSETLRLAKAREGREAADFNNTPDQYAPNPNAGQPGQPQYIDQYAQAARAAVPVLPPDGYRQNPDGSQGYITGGPADPTVVASIADAKEKSGKPIPFETLSGTKFLIPQSDGSYSTMDPRAVGSPQPGQPNPQALPAVNPAAAGSPQPQPMVQPQPATAPPVAVQPQPGPTSAPQMAQPPLQPQPAQSPANLDEVDPKTGRREAWLQSQPPDVQAYIKKIADYEIDPRTTSIKGGHREQVMSAVAQYDPTYDQNNFGSRAKAIRDFATGTQGNSVRSFDVAIDHMDTLKKYVTALDSGDTRLLNTLRNRWLQETGSPLPTNVQAIAPIVGAEVSKAIIGSNNALADREELRKPLALANSPSQVLGAIEGYQELMAGQLKGLKKQYEDTTGKKDFNKRIRENTQNVLLGGAKGGGAQPGAPAPGNYVWTPNTGLVSQ